MEAGEEFPQKFDTTTGICEMTITETFQEDEGIISCQAANRFGEATTQCFLTVTGNF